MFGNNPYLEALEFIRRNPGTGGGAGLAKLVLSLYNSCCGYSFAECTGSLDSNLTTLALRMVNHYATHGETEELRTAGKEIADTLYPGLWEMGIAMRDSREQVRAKWEREDREKEAAAIEAVENRMINGEIPRIPTEDAMRMLVCSEGQVYAWYHQQGRWREQELSIDAIRHAIEKHGTSLTDICPESSYMLAVQVQDKMHYISTDWDARESYLASLNGN